MADQEHDQNGGGAAPDMAVARVHPGDWRVVLLGIYLALITITGLYFLGLLMTAETPENIETPGTASQGPGSTNTQANPASQNSATPRNAGSPTGEDGGDNSDGNAAAAPSDSGSPPAISIPNGIRLSAGGREFKLTSDGYVFLIVLLAGMLGAAVRCIFSFFRHLGVGDFGFNWLWYYLMLPPGGATLSLVIYFVIRGGFYSSTLGKGLALNVFSFAALGALTGLFSGNAMEKLKQVAETLLAPAEAPPVNPGVNVNNNGGPE